MNQLVAEIDRRPLSWLQIGVVLLSSLVALIDGYDLALIAFAVPSIAASWKIEPHQFAYVMAAAHIGIVPGSMLLAPMADRVGRKPVIVISLLAAGLFTLGTVLATDLIHLFACRLMVGVALGACLPTAYALTSDYLPARRRAALLTLMFCNIAVGGAIGGMLTPVLTAAFGWRGLFVFGGLLAVSVAAVVTWLLPESVHFLARHRPNDRRLGMILARIAPGFQLGRDRTDGAFSNAPLTTSAIAIWRAPYAAAAGLLCALSVLNCLVLNLLVAWLPVLLSRTGWTSSASSGGGVMLQIGSVLGGLGLSFLIDLGLGRLVVTGAFLTLAVGLGAFLIVPSDPLMWGVLLVLVGSVTGGSQFILNAVTASIFPSPLLAAAIGAVGAAGRAGAIVGPLVGGMLIASGYGAATILATLVPAAVVCVFISLRLNLGRIGQPGAPPASMPGTA